MMAHSTGDFADLLAYHVVDGQIRARRPRR